MFGGIGIDRLLLPAVYRQVGLSVAVELQSTRHDPPTNRLLEDAGADVPAFPVDFTRQADIHRDDVHVVISSIVIAPIAWGLTRRCGGIVSRQADSLRITLAYRARTVRD